MKKALFTGVCTALVTPFLDGKINYPMMEKLLRRQIDAGIRAVVISGTTGEAPALTDQEKLELFRASKSYVGDDCLIIAGTGSNNTEHTVKLSHEAEDADVDGLLMVSPYYNKATSEGLYQHYRHIAESVTQPVILYNVPSRTGLDIDIDTYQRLSRISNIAGIKEASTDITKITKIRCTCGDEMPIWTGNDGMITPAISLGCSGVISVVSNVFPEETQALAQAALAEDFTAASALQISLQPLVDALFCEVSPVPAKAAMKLIGYDCGGCRLPLSEMKAENRNRLKNALLR